MPTLAALWHAFASVWTPPPPTSPCNVTYNAHIPYNSRLRYNGCPGVALSGGQVALQGLVMGPATKYRVESIDGLSKPDVRDSDLAKNADHGFFAGRDLLDRRSIRFKAAVLCPSAPSQMPGLLNELGRAMVPVTSPVVLTFRLPGDVEKIAYVMPRRLAYLVDGMVNAGGYAPFAAELVAPDPLIYGSTLYSPAVGTRFLANAGTWPVKPILTVVGPATNPAITLGSETVRVNLSLAAGAVLVVDFAKRTVIQGGVYNRYDALDPTSSFWSIGPGSNILSPNQSSFETDTSGWAVGANCAISQGAVAAHGSFSLAINPSAAGLAYANTPGSTFAAIPVSASMPYYLTQSWRAASVARSVYAQITWIDSGGSAISADVGTPIASSTGAFAQATLAATAPPGAVYAQIYAVIASAGGAGEVQYLDKVGLSLGATAPPWALGAAQSVAYTGGGTATLAYRDCWL